VLDFGSQGDPSLVFDLVESVSDWRVAPVCLRTPASGSPTPATVNVGRLVVAGSGKGTSLLHSAALRGFRGMHLTDLKALHCSLEVPTEIGNKPRTEAEYLTALVKHAIPSIEDEALHDILCARVKAATPELAVSDAHIFKDRDMLEILLEEAGDEDDRQELERWRAKVDAEHKRELKMKADLHAMRSAAEGASGSAGPANRAPATTQVRDADSGYSVQDARGWAPPGCTLTKETKWHTRWRASSEEMGGVKSKPFTAAGPVTDFKAMVWVLTVAWRSYTAVHGHPCPWQFEGDML